MGPGTEKLILDPQRSGCSDSVTFDPIPPPTWRSGWASAIPERRLAGTCILASMSSHLDAALIDHFICRPKPDATSIDIWMTLCPSDAFPRFAITLTPGRHRSVLVCRATF